MDSYTEKSEKPTTKRLKKAKEEGQFPYSPLFASSLLLLSILLLLFFHFPVFLGIIKTLFINSFSLMTSTTQIDISLLSVFMPLVKEVTFFLIMIFLLAFVAHSWQNHFSFSWKKGAKRKSHKGYFFFYTVISWSLITLLGYFSMISLHDSFSQDVTILFKQLFIILVKVCVLFFVLALVDYFFQRHFFYQDMHMTKEELKEEWKEEKVAKK